MQIALCRCDLNLKGLSSALYALSFTIIIVISIHRMFNRVVLSIFIQKKVKSLFPFKLVILNSSMHIHSNVYIFLTRNKNVSNHFRDSVSELSINVVKECGSFLCAMNFRIHILLFSFF